MNLCQSPKIESTIIEGYIALPGRKNNNNERIHTSAYTRKVTEPIPMKIRFEIQSTPQNKKIY